MSLPSTEQNSEHKQTNRLVYETSPYLQQHAHNPVDWYAWGEEALERARREDKPILLSIGYSTCHWCHVMERESFESEEIARIMNEHFVNIKVDREERPDLDAIYMNVVQMLTGQGGWPMTVFLTPDGEPFYGGTYFPPDDRYGRPGFPRLLLQIAETYRARRPEIAASVQEIVKELRRLSAPKPAEGDLSPDVLDRAYENLAQQFDPRNGGFGGAPKFPAAMNLIFLLRYYRRTKTPRALEMVELSLMKMAGGGIYDQLGGGFHRYSTDEKWLAPHFEKMLYDNALLSRLYLYAFQVTGNAFYKRIAEETLQYVMREMTNPGGGFYSAQDADSEGLEGEFFVWTPGEVRQVLGEEEGQLFCKYYDVTRRGNFEGKNILNAPRDMEVMSKLENIDLETLSDIIERGRKKLFQQREHRIKPHRDEKVLTGWNGLMLRSFAEAARILGRNEYRQVAVRNAEFLLEHLRRDGRLLRTTRDGTSKLNAYLEDYALLIDGLLALYEATFELSWLEEARSLADTMVQQFWDDVEGGFYFTSSDHETLIARTKEFYDNATPSGNSAAADVLLRLGRLLDNQDDQRRARRVCRIMSDAVTRFPSAFGHLLGAIDFSFQSKEIAFIGAKDSADTQALVQTLFQRFLPNKVVAFKEPNDDRASSAIPLLRDREMADGKATAYVCENFACQTPVTESEALARQLE